jgi:hypothetical protein
MLRPAASATALMDVMEMNLLVLRVNAATVDDVTDRIAAMERMSVVALVDVMTTFFPAARPNKVELDDATVTV